MTDSPQDPIKRFITSIKAHRAYVDFGRNTTIAFHTIMGIINKTERLRALAKLRKEATNEICEIAKLEDYRSPAVFSNIMDLWAGNNKVDNWCDYEGKAVEPPIDREKALETRKKIHGLWQHITKINDEIGRLKILIEAQKPGDHKSINRKFMDLFKDPSKAIDTIQLLRDRGVIDKDQKWVGISNPKKKGEIKLIWDVLNTYGLFKDGEKETTSARIFYDRFKFEENYNERILRQIIKDIKLREEYEELFKNLPKS